MNILHLAYDMILEALFPISPAEKWLLSLDVESIIRQLPRAKNMPIPEACSIFSYKDERVWQMVWSVKYRKSKRAVKISSFALHRIIQNYLLIVPKIVIIPMPVSKQRRRERGFNQCELLTAEIKKISKEERADHFDSNYSNHKLIFINDLLLRKKNTSRQTLKNRTNRLQSAHGLFQIDEKVLTQSKLENISFDTHQTDTEKQTMIIIIDDVVTTGSTMKEAIQTMRNAGFTNTWGLSVAH